MQQSFKKSATKIANISNNSNFLQENMLRENYYYSIMPGLRQIPSGASREVKERIWAIVSDKPFDIRLFCRRFYRWKNIPAHVKEEIDNVFTSYGVPTNQIWEIKV